MEKMVGRTTGGTKSASININAIWFLRFCLVKEMCRLLALSSRGLWRDDITTVDILGLSIKEEADITHDSSPEKL
jgi:hypothetical protein